MFASLSRCQPSGHTVRSQEVTTGNFLFDQPIDTHRASLQRRFKNRNQEKGRGWMHMQRTVPRWAPLRVRNIKVQRARRCVKAVRMLRSFQNICAARPSLLGDGGGR